MSNRSVTLKTNKQTINQGEPCQFNVAFPSQGSHDTERRLIQSLKINTGHFIVVVLHLYCSVHFKDGRRYSSAKHRSENLTK